MLTSKVDSNSYFHYFKFRYLLLLLSFAFLPLQANAAKGGKGKPPPEPPAEFDADMAFTAPYIKKDKLSPLALGSSSETSTNESRINAYTKSFSPDGKWLVYHTHKVDDDGSRLNSVAISPVDDLTLLSQSILFDTPDRAEDQTDDIFADVNNPLWIKIAGENYLLIGHSSDSNMPERQFYLQLIPLTSSVEAGKTRWEAEIYNQDGNKITKGTRYTPSECNLISNPPPTPPTPTPTPKITCYSVKIGSKHYFPSAVDYGIASTNPYFALYMIAYDRFEDSILDKYKLFKIPIIINNNNKPELGLIFDITPSRTMINNFENHRVIGVAGSKKTADDVYFSSYFYEVKRGELSFTASSIWKLETGVPFQSTQTLIYDTTNDLRGHDYFTDLDISCNDASLLLDNNAGEIKLLDVSGSSPPSLLFDGNYPKWIPLVPCQ